MRYTYTWVGPGGTASWNEPGNWDIRAVPNHPKADVVFPNGRTRNLDISGIALSLGSLSSATQYGHTFNLVSSDDTPLALGAAGSPAFLRTRENNHADFTFSMPVEIAGETFITQNDPHYPFRFNKSVYGAGPLITHCVKVKFAAPIGVTNVVSVPLASHPEILHLSTFGVQGPGAVLLENHTATLSLAAGYDDGLVGLGGTLVWRGSVITNINPNGVSSLFFKDNNTLRIEKGSILTYPSFYDTHMWSSGNTLLVTDPGSQFHITLMMDETIRSNNTIRVRDGAYMSNRDRYYNPFTVRGVNHLIQVSSDLPGRPAVLEFFANSWNNAVLLEGENATLSLQPGGIIKCGGILTLGSSKGGATGNRVSLEGGELLCDALNVYAGNALATQLTASLQPLIAKTSVTFEAGAKIIVTNPGNVTGKFALVKAPEITAPLNDPAFLDAPPQYKLTLEGKPGEQTLFLTCSALDI